MLDREIFRIDQKTPYCADLPYRSWSGVGPQISNAAAIFEMQFPGAAVIIQTVRDVRVLLYLADRYARADRMDCSGRHKNKIALVNGAPVQESFDLAARGNTSQFLRRHRLFETKRDLRSCSGFNHVPGFRLTEAMMMLPCILVARVHLYR